MQKSIAETLVGSKDFDELWDQVDTVERTDDGDLYTYPDGSKLVITAHATKLVI